jgi:hypothetical protein
MATLKEYFEADFYAYYCQSWPQPIFAVDNRTGNSTQFDIQVKVYNDGSCPRTFVFYIPQSTIPHLLIETALNGLNGFVKEAETLEVTRKYESDVLIGNVIQEYSNRIFIYCESNIGISDFGGIWQFCDLNDIHVIIRSSKYVTERMEKEIPQAFISHDSKDKVLIARPLANGLSSRACTVWYDEFTLKIGASLRESIEEGIKKARKCIIVITPNFLSNPGWGKREFNSIFTREMVMNERIVLPIWYGVSAREIYEYSPSLADTFALTWPDETKLSQPDYKRAVEELITKVHAELIKDK